MIKFKTDASIQTTDFTEASNALNTIKKSAMAGWLDVPVSPEELDNIKATAAKIQSDSKFLICVGIGGSYLGHKAMIDALGNRSQTKIVYAGNSLSSYELDKLFAMIGTSDFSVNVISKSGTTTEPAIAFRLLKAGLKQKYGEKHWSSRVYVTTDADSGALHDEALKYNYQRFTIPANVGGRFSILSAVALLPMAVAGLDIDQMITGAKTASFGLSSDFALAMSPANIDPSVNVIQNAVRYAIVRQRLYSEQEKETEVLACFEPRLATFLEWWKQLFGESEGKNNKGIFPASVVYTTDLHSLGQYMQEGRRNIFETVIKVKKPNSRSIIVPEDKDDLDGLNYLAGKNLDYINAKAEEATIHAHRLGGIPVLEIEVEDLSEKSFGELIFFFEIACAISAQISGVDPFNQPGVESYKTNMFKLLGKPGF